MMKNSSAIYTGVRILFLAACAALPFIGLTHLSTYCFMAAGALLLFSRNVYVDWRDPVVLLFAGFYGLQLIGFFINPAEGNKFALEQKASLFFIPVFVSALAKFDASLGKQGIKIFIAGNVAAMLYCLAVAVFHYGQNSSAANFFYHTFSSPLDANAIYCSLYVTVSLLYLIHFYLTGRKISTWIFLPFVLLLSVSLVLLSSKTIIVSGILLVLYLTVSGARKRVRFFLTAAIVFLMSLLFLTANPVSRRFDELKWQQTRHILNADNFFNYPFDDITIRVLLARMGWEVSDERHAWLSGNEGKHYHQFLNRKMRDYRLFEGNETTGDTGYINYNMHNQYLENFMQYGIVGVLILISILVLGIRQSVKSGNKIFLATTLLFAMSFLTESVLETQAGVLLFTLIFAHGWTSTKLKT